MSRNLQATSKAIELVTKATDEDKKKNYQEALRLYEDGCKYFLHALKYEASTSSTKETIRVKLEEYLERAEKLHEYIAKKKKQDAKSDKRNTESVELTKVKGKDEDEEEDLEMKRLETLVSGSIVKEIPNVKWTDIAGLETAKDALQEAVILPQRFPLIFQDLETWKAILLFGPPGTGKTNLARAVATETSGATFFSVTAADLISKWQGESEKCVRALFKLARHHKPSIIFLDEVDSLGSARGESETESSRRVKSEFLRQMDGMNDGSSNDDVLVLAATNLPWLLDEAILRRFQKRIYIPLPDKEARALIFQLSLSKTVESLTKEDYMHLGQLTKGYSCSDVRVVVREGKLEPIRKMRSATHFRKVMEICPEKQPENEDDVMYTPCSPGHPDALEMSVMDVPRNKAIPPKLSLLDLENAIKVIKPSVNPKSLERLEDYVKNFGQTG